MKNLQSHFKVLGFTNASIYIEDLETTGCCSVWEDREAVLSHLNEYYPGRHVYVKTHSNEGTVPVWPELV